MRPCDVQATHHGYETHLQCRCVIPYDSEERMKNLLYNMEAKNNDITYVRKYAP